MSFKAVIQNCSRRHVKGEKTTNNTKIVANMLAATAAAATSTYAATIIIANIIDHTFMIFFLVSKSRNKGKKRIQDYGQF